MSTPQDESDWLDATVEAIQLVQSEWHGQLVSLKGAPSYRAIGVVRYFATNYGQTHDALLYDLCKVIEEGQKPCLDLLTHPRTVVTLKSLHRAFVGGNVRAAIKTVSDQIEFLPLKGLQRITQEEAKALLLSEITRAL